MARWNLKGEGEQGRSVRGQLRLTDESTPHTVQAARGAVGADEPKQRGTTMREGHAVSAQCLLGVWNEYGGD